MPRDRRAESGALDVCMGRTDGSRGSHGGRRRAEIVRHYRHPGAGPDGRLAGAGAASRRHRPRDQRLRCAPRPRRARARAGGRHGGSGVTGGGRGRGGSGRAGRARAGAARAVARDCPAPRATRRRQRPGQHQGGGRPLGARDAAGPITLHRLPPDGWQGAVRHRSGRCRPVRGRGLVPDAGCGSGAGCAGAAGALVAALGARPLVLDPARHDEAVAGASHLPLLAATALVLAVSAPPDWPDVARLAAGGFRDTTRVASGDPRMARDIALSNREPILRRLDAYIAVLQGLRARVAAGDPESSAPSRTPRRRATSGCARDRASLASRQGENGHLNCVRARGGLQSLRSLGMPRGRARVRARSRGARAAHHHMARPGIYAGDNPEEGRDARPQR